MKVARSVIVPFRGPYEKSLSRGAMQAVRMRCSEAFRTANKDLAAAALRGSETLLGLPLVFRGDALGGAVLGANGADLLIGAAGGGHGKDVSAVVGSHQALPTRQRNVEDRRHLFEGRARVAAVVVMVLVVVNVSGLIGSGTGQFDADDFAFGMLEAKALELLGEAGFQVHPTGAPGLTGDQDRFTAVFKEAANLDRFQIVKREDPEARRTKAHKNYE